ncbi:MAG: arginase family protein, partial [Gemmatimonadota bacterium]
GNCSSSHGTLAALGGEPAVVWFDAHADFNTPETTVSGFFDGMALAVAAGRCWSALAAALPGFAPVDERRILLVGTRDLDPGERRLLEDSRIARIPGGMPAADAEAALEGALAELSDRASTAYLHVDLDVIDAREAPVNPWSSAGGFTSAELTRALTQVRRSVPVRAATLSAYDPGCDPDGRALEVALQTLVALVEPLA